MRKKLPRTNFLNTQFGIAVKDFGLQLRKSSAIQHPGSKGGEREDGLKNFLMERLPTRFSVVSGEVVDVHGNTSPQLDIMIYDKSVNFPLLSASTQVLPAEALLAAIEVKSTISNAEVIRCCEAARKLRKLRPYGKKLKGTDVGENPDSSARYYYGVFAYASDLVADSWKQNEHSRFKKADGGKHLVDLVYVLDRGIINVSEQKGRDEDENGGAITAFYFSILNFITREAGRRKETPYQQYTASENRSWVWLADTRS